MMASPTRRSEPAAGFADDVYLPAELVTFNGCTIETGGMVWRWPALSGWVNLDFGCWVARAPHLLQSIKAVFAWYAENTAECTVRGYFFGMRLFIQAPSTTLRNGAITSIAIANYRGSLNPAIDWYMGQISAPITRWFEAGWPGVSKCAYQLLAQMVVPGNRKGDAVRTLDPLRGPFTDAELQALTAGLHRAFDGQQISRADYVISLLLLCVAPRPIQIAAMKVIDFEDGGVGGAALQVPRAKQGMPMRTEFRKRNLNDLLAAQLRSHITEVGAQRDMVFTLKDMPLFPRLRGVSGLSGFEYHNSAALIASRAVAALTSTVVYSERTGDPIAVHSRRFRHTLGTRLAEDGCSAEEIADALDHGDYPLDPRSTLAHKGA